MSKIIIPENSPLWAALEELISACQLLLFAGIPGVGKSLFLQQAALLAQQAGRKVHLLQMDVIRPAFETPDHLARYPERDGVTHPMIIKALGVWTRAAVLDWHRRYAGSPHLLVGEAPLIGGRLIELARPEGDTGDTVLGGEDTRFVLPVPTAEVRQKIESKRQMTIAVPQH